MKNEDIKQYCKTISSPTPVFWIAEYNNKYEKLKIPICQKCGLAIEVKNYSNIECKKCGNFENFKWENIELNHHLLTEYNESGQEILNFSLIPKDRIEKFYFYISPKDMLVGINLKNGEYFIEGVEVGTGVIAKNIPLVISNQIPKYSDNLFHFKSALKNFNDSTKLIWYKMGYSCRLKGVNVVIMLFVHIPTLHPYFFTQCEE